MTFLDKYKLNLFLGLSFLIFISIYSISNTDIKNRNEIRSSTLTQNDILEVTSINSGLFNNHRLNDKIQKLNTSFSDWTKYASNGRTYLTYYIHDGILEGNIKGKYLKMMAGSGGGVYAASNYAKSVFINMINNVCYTNKAVTYNSRYGSIFNTERGGPIVPGTYSMSPDIGGTCVKANGKTFENRYIELIPDKKSWGTIYELGRRGGFRIHFKGGIGSDGCIVPEEYHDFLKIMNQVQRTKGGTLIVKKSMGEIITCGDSLIDNL